MASPRAYRVILAGLLFGPALVGATVRQLRQPHLQQTAPLHSLDATARLAFGVGLVLLAGRTLWATGAGGTADVPGWAVPLGAVVEGLCALSALVAGGF